MMRNARRVASGSCVALAILVTGCLGDAVRDYVLEQIESQQADAGDAAVASTESGSAESAAGSPDASGQGESTPRPATALAPVASPIAPRDTQPAAPPRYESDATNSSPSRGQSNDSADQASANRPGDPASGSTQPEIRLRTAVALAQTLPTGTAMGFSVDYQFSGAAPRSQVQYVWVIKPPSGEPWESVVQLQSRGTLQTFVTQWGPVSGTYEMRIDEVTRYDRKPASRPVLATYR